MVFCLVTPKVTPCFVAISAYVDQLKITDSADRYRVYGPTRQTQHQIGAIRLGKQFQKAGLDARAAVLFSFY